MCCSSGMGGLSRAGGGQQLQMRGLEQVWDWVGLEQDVGVGTHGNRGPSHTIFPRDWGARDEGVPVWDVLGLRVPQEGRASHPDERGMEGTEGLWRVPVLYAVPRPSAPPLGHHPPDSVSQAPTPDPRTSSFHVPLPLQLGAGTRVPHPRGLPAGYFPPKQSLK